MNQLTAMFLLLTGTAHCQAEEPRNPALLALPANSWVYLNPRPYMRQTPLKRDVDAPLKAQTVKEPPFREYTNPVYGNGKIYYFGGGHSGYPGNDMEIFDPVANTWRQCGPPRCPPKDDSTYYSGGSERGYVDPDTGACHPYVLHGYARTGYDEKLQAYVCTAMFPTKVERDPATQKWQLVSKAFGLIAFDEKTNAWRWLAPTPNRGADSLSQFDRDQGGLLGFFDREVRLFRDGRWANVATTPFPLGMSGGSPSVYVPDQKVHIVARLGHGGKQEKGELVVFDPKAKATRRLDKLPDELQARIAAGTGGHNLAMTYNTKARKLVVMSMSKTFHPDVWLYDVAADRWDKLPAAPTVPSFKSSFEPGMGRAPLLYDPVHNVCFLILRKGDSVETWAYRTP